MKNTGRHYLSAMKKMVKSTLSWSEEDFIKFVLDIKDLFLVFGIRSVLLKFRIKHIYGIHSIDYDDDELVVICLVRNGELYIKSFMNHYLNMGVKHFFFMDNCSTDSTIDLLSSYDCVTILQANVNFIKYESTIRRYLAKRFSKGKWNLVSDIDELFDYPYSDQIPLKSFLKYLNFYSYNAVIAQMLDMFSSTPLAEIVSKPSDSLPDKYPYYDISDVKKVEYVYSTSSNPNIKMYLGGIRKTIFGTNSGLTKVALVKVEKNLEVFIHWHHVKNANLADLSCLLRHYPFLGSFYNKVKDAIENERYGKKGRTDFYEKIWEKLQLHPNLSMKLSTGEKLLDSGKLIDQEFIVVSSRYREWVKDHRSDNTFVE